MLNTQFPITFSYQFQQISPIPPSDMIKSEKSRQQKQERKRESIPINFP